MPILKIRAEESLVVVSIEVSRIDETFSLRFEAGRIWAARLLANAMRVAFEQRMSFIREEEYKRGWKDAKSRNCKSTYFSDSLP